MSNKLWKSINDWVNGVTTPIEEWICFNPSIPEIHNKTIKQILEEQAKKEVLNNDD